MQPHSTATYNARLDHDARKWRASQDGRDRRVSLTAWHWRVPTGYYFTLTAYFTTVVASTVLSSDQRRYHADVRFTLLRYVEPVLKL